MKHRMISLVTEAIILTGLFLSQASANDKGGPVLVAGYAIGGETLAEVYYSDFTVQEIRAGTGAFFAGGYQFPVNEDGSVKSLFSLGYITDSSFASNGEVSFDRYYLDALLSRDFDHLRFAAGLSYHLGVTLEGSEVVRDIDVEFENTLGFVAEASYLFQHPGALTLRYLDIDYTVEETGERFDGAGIGLYYGFGF